VKAGIAARATNIGGTVPALGLEPLKGLPMKVLLRIVAVLFALIAALLIYAVINALGSDGGARPGVAVAYIVGSIVLIWGAVTLWRRGGPATTVQP
jgi:hypothetical protein